MSLDESETFPTPVEGANNAATVAGKKKRRRVLRADEADKWHEHFQDLCDFKNRYNHTLVPHTYTINPSLGRWVKRQRYQHKRRQQGKESSMLPERVELLEKIGFVWDSHEAAWKEKLEELIKFKNVNGHCDVPYYFPPNSQLATWATRQRRQYTLYNQKKNSSMTPGRIETLENLGFKWNPRQGKGTTQAASPPKEVDDTPRKTISASAVLSGQTEPTTDAFAVDMKFETQAAVKHTDKLLSGLKAVNHAPLTVCSFPIPESDCDKFSETDGRMFLEVLDDLSSDDESKAQSKEFRRPSKRANLEPDHDGFEHHADILSSVLSDLSDDEVEDDDDASLKEFSRPWSETFDADFICGI